jgi:hypothetical protein
MYLLDRDKLGGLSTSPTPVSIVGGTEVPAKKIGYCWCGQSYFEAPDGVDRVVSSGGSEVKVWNVKTSSSGIPALKLEAKATLTDQGQSDGGFFTAVSSHVSSSGKTKDVIIWAVQRPTGNAQVSLYAFDPIMIDPTTHIATTILQSTPAGTWPNYQNSNGGSNADTVPMVANGKVYVASYRQLAIFGLGAIGTTQILNPPGFPQPLNFRAIYGTVEQVDGSVISIKLRSGQVVKADVTAAAHRRRGVPVAVGGTVGVFGLLDEKSGVIQANKTVRMEGAPASWPADR